MPSLMNALDPIPQIRVAEAWRLRATQAGRSARGLVATVQLWEGDVMRLSRTFHLDDEAETTEVLEEYTAHCGATPELLEQALRDLYVGIEEALRRQAEPVERPKKADIGEEAQR
jgi:hypothetical protein